MKTTICDICGISKEDVRKRGLGTDIYQFKAKVLYGVPPGLNDERTFDICGDCLKLIKVMMENKRNGKTTI